MKKHRSLPVIIFAALLIVSTTIVFVVGGVLIATEMSHQNIPLGSAGADPIINQRITLLLGLLIGVLGLAALVSYFIVRKISGQLNLFLDDMRTFALDNKPIDTSRLDIKELYTLGQTANRFSQQRALMLRELQRLSQRDPLTDLYNRRHISEILVLEEARCKRKQGGFGLIICDIDFFKAINDSLGHDAGDVVLRQVAQSLKNTLRKHDYIARWGGEEFLIMLPDANLNASKCVAEKLCEAIGNLHIPYKDQMVNVTITCGVTLHGGEMELMESIDRADKALYDGKRGGRNRVVIKPPVGLAVAS
ncbi:signal transduction diguanylate cyclase [Oleiphilus messinensis]|uniref:diguanylate cyclase n=1 Tax=Oleiphilus messinensis TaxID=141451 RepID=A0A1Y0IE45_9GAMM|nr:GGDEF domain-containing protein [Oleiphilus messinensis]ARU58550.1 signal transduction diguanylate cyclase [Oleiphilus messinensis]